MFQIVNSNNTTAKPKEELRQARNFVRIHLYLSFIFILAHLQDKYFCVYDVLLLDINIVILPDIPKEVTGHEEAEADEQDTGQPETVVAPCETSMEKTPQEAGLSDSHLERPLQGHK